MPISNFPKSAAGPCCYCGNRARLLTQDHPECYRTYQADWTRMAEFAADAAQSHNSDEKSLRLSLAETARNSLEDGNTVNQALQEG